MLKTAVAIHIVLTWIIARTQVLIFIGLCLCSFPNFYILWLGCRYDRVTLSVDRVTAAVSSQPLPDNLAEASIFVYVSKTPGGQPSNQFPIFQTYLDVMLRGCFEISPSFANTFLQTTQHWEPADPTEGNAYLDDRHAPGYLRYDPVASSKHNAAVNDEIIRRYRNTDLARRVRGPDMK